MQEKSSVDTEFRHRCQTPKTIPIVGINYQATPDGEKRLLEALTLLLKERMSQPIGSEESSQKIGEKTENGC